MGMRVERLGEFIRTEVATILQREFSDPRLKFVSITRVALTKDMRHAKIFYSALDVEQKGKTIAAALEQARARVQALLAPHIRARFMPTLSFEFDPGLAEAVRLSGMIDKAVAEDKARAAAREARPPRDEEE